MSDPEQALQRIAFLALEEGDYDYEPLTQSLDIALEALGWVYWRCSSRFTNCRAGAVGFASDLRKQGWTEAERCPRHARTVDPIGWPEGRSP